MFERYTENARRAIFFARYEASQYGSPTIETEHLLLGLGREDRALASRFIRTPIESIRKEIESRIAIRERTSPSVEVPFSQECKRILNYAAEEAERLGHRNVGTEHLLLGILREDQCLGARILQAHEVTLSRVREEVTTTRAKEWCCAEFQARCYQPGKREHGLGIFVLVQSRVGMFFLLEYRRPDRTPSDPIAADGIKLKFCPWCGVNLPDWYASGLPPFDPPTSQ